MNFIKNIVEKYIYECYIIKRQKVAFHNKFITLNILSSEFIYNDLIKPLTLIDFNDYKYFIMFKDDFIYYFEIYYIRHKNKTFIMFLHFKIYLKSHDYRIYRIHLNNENEYIINVFLKYLAQSNIKQKFIIINNFEMNEIVERFNQILINKIHFILLNFNLNKFF